MFKFDFGQVKVFSLYSNLFKISQIIQITQRNKGQNYEAWHYKTYKIGTNSKEFFIHLALTFVKVLVFFEMY